jgi:hypothetical protein
MDGVGRGCVEVTVIKSTTLGTTQIQAKGKNRCYSTDPRRVERAIEFKY